MVSDVTRSLRLRCTFALGEAELLYLEKVLTEFSPCGVEVETKDGTTLRRGSMKEALAFPNATEREVTKITIKTAVPSRDDDLTRYKGHVMAVLDADDPRVNIWISVTGEDQALYVFFQDLRAWFNEQRPWWAIAAEKALPSIPSGGLVAALFVLTVVLGVNKWLIYRPGQDSLTSLAVLFFGGWVTASLVIGFLFSDLGVLYPAIQYLFPVSAFTFGYGKKRYALRRDIRNLALSTLFGTILLGFAVNVAASMYTTPAVAMPQVSADAGPPLTDAGPATDDAGK